MSIAIKYVTLGLASTNAYLLGDDSGQAILIARRNFFGFASI